MRASQNGLAIQLITSSAEITDSTFSGLYSKSGPAIYAHDLPQSSVLQSINVQRCNFSDNYALELGGSVVIKDLSAMLTDSTLQRNKADIGSGGALFLSCSIQNLKGCSFQV